MDATGIFQRPQMVFASPDFGASGVIVIFLLIAWGIVLLSAGLGVLRGLSLINSQSRRRRKLGILLLLLSGFAPLSCCLGPSLIRVVFGH
jgi:hypothetical protein